MGLVLARMKEVILFLSGKNMFAINYYWSDAEGRWWFSWVLVGRDYLKEQVNLYRETIRSLRSKKY